MNNPGTEGNAMTELTEVMRHHPWRGRSAFASLASGSGRDTSPELTRTKEELVQLVRRFIPPHPAYNDLSLYALTRIHGEGLATADPVADRGRIDEVVNDIRQRSPTFGRSISDKVDDLGDLYEQLNKYRKISRGTTQQYPPMEILGHRQDELTLGEWIMPNQADRIVKDTPEDRKQRGKTNACIDKIIPKGAYFNKLRQSLIDDLMEPAPDKSITRGAAIAKWVNRESEIAQEREKSGTTEFIKNQFHYYKTEAVKHLGQKTRPWKEELEKTPVSFGNLTPEIAVSIGKRIHEYHSTPVINDRQTADEGERPAKRLRQTSIAPAKRLRQTLIAPVRGPRQTSIALRGSGSPPLQVPQAIKSAVCEVLPRRFETNQQTTDSARAIAVTMNGVFKPNRTNFKERLKFLQSVSSERDILREGNELGLHELGKLNVISEKYHKQFKGKEDQIQRLIRQLDDYHEAWERGPQRQSADSVEEKPKTSRANTGFPAHDSLRTQTSATARAEEFDHGGSISNKRETVAGLMGASEKPPAHSAPTKANAPAVGRDRIVSREERRGAGDFSGGQTEGSAQRASQAPKPSYDTQLGKRSRARSQCR